MVDVTQAKKYVKEHPRVVMVALVLIVVVIVVLIVHAHGEASEFTNPNNIHRYVVGQDGLSMDDKINAAAATVPKSGLTGTRDVPVFFQDFGMELAADETGNLVAQRSGDKVSALAGDKDEIADIEKKFMLGNH